MKKAKKRYKFTSFSSGSRRVYTYNTSLTKHKKCMDAVAAKCKWEQMTRLGVLMEWQDILCEECAKVIDIRLETDE